MTWKRKQANWQIESPRLSSSTKSHEWLPYKAQASNQQGLGEEPIQRYQRKEFAVHWSEVDAPMQCFGMFLDSLKADEVWMKRGIDGRARMEKRTRREAKWKLRTRQDRSLRSRVDQFAKGAAQGGRKLDLNPPESLVKSEIARVVKVVLCELRLERKHRSMSSHIHYYFSFSLIFCIIFSDKVSLHAFSPYPPHSSTCFLMFSSIMFRNCFHFDLYSLTKT